METFKLTTGETITGKGDDWWLGECSLDECGMEYDENQNYVCKTPEADEWARKLVTQARAFEREADAIYEERDCLNFMDKDYLPKEQAIKDEYALRHEKIANAIQNCATDADFRVFLKTMGIVVP